MKKMPVFFHTDQLLHKPLFEWAFGEKILHPEKTARAESILLAIGQEDSEFELMAPLNHPNSSIKSVHNKKLIQAIQSAQNLPDGMTFYPSVFPYHRDKSKLDPTNINHAGAFCFDSGTPLNSTTYGAAAWSAACAYAAADCVAKKQSKTAYALCRPPGHHASKDLFGGYCYFNNAAIAAKRLRENVDRVAIIDIDFHHGNGTQVIFARDPSVLVINIHGDPNHCYPYLTGFATECGSGPGDGFNINFPLSKGTDGQAYLSIVEEEVLRLVRKFSAQAIVLSAGFDTYINDPIGEFALETSDFTRLGEKLASLNKPTVIVQEGGYEEHMLGANVVAFLHGFRS